MNTISAEELKKALQSDTIELIDVREPYEYEDRNLGGKNIPLDEVLSSVEIISKDKKVVFCCQTGKRSGAIVMTLCRKFDFNNLYSLDGGVNAFLED